MNDVNGWVRRITALIYFLAFSGALSGGFACGGAELETDNRDRCNTKRESEVGLEGLPCAAGFWVSCTCDSGRQGSRLCRSDGRAYVGNCRIIELSSSETESPTERGVQ